MSGWRLFATSFAVVFVLAPSTFSQEPVKRPSYREGQFWQFKYRSWDWQLYSYDSRRLNDGIYEIVYSQKRLTAFYAGPGEREKLEPPLAGNVLFLMGRGRDFNFPLSVGKKWSYEYTQMIHIPEPSHIAFVQRIAELSIEGIESITTEAGTFEVLKIVKINRPTTYSQRWISNFYYSPQTRSVIKWRWDTSVDTGRGVKMEALLIKHGGADATDLNKVAGDAQTGN